MPRYHVKITGRDYNAMADLVLKYKVLVARHTVEKLAKGYRVDAHANGRQLRALESAGYKIKRLEDVDKGGKARQKEVSKVSKKAVAGEVVPVLQLAHYLNVVEVAPQSRPRRTTRLRRLLRCQTKPGRSAPVMRLRSAKAATAVGRQSIFSAACMRASGAVRTFLLTSCKD